MMSPIKVDFSVKLYFSFLVPLKHSYIGNKFVWKLIAFDMTEKQAMLCKLSLKAKYSGANSSVREANVIAFSGLILLS
jgi:hypothetical protein